MTRTKSTPNTYKRAIAVASDLVEGVDLTNAANREYTRGIVEFMADFFPQSASYMDERKAKVARDLGIDPDDIEAAGYDGRGDANIHEAHEAV